MKILVIEDEENVQELFRRAFKGHAIFSAYDIATALVMVSEHKPDLVLLDLRLPDSPEPIETAAQIATIKQMIPNSPVVVVTGHSTQEIERIVIAAGGTGVAKKGGMKGVLDDIKDLVCKSEETNAQCRRDIEEALGCKL